MYLLVAVLLLRECTYSTAVHSVCVSCNSCSSQNSKEFSFDIMSEQWLNAANTECKFLQIVRCALLHNHGNGTCHPATCLQGHVRHVCLYRCTKQPPTQAAVCSLASPPLLMRRSTPHCISYHKHNLQALMSSNSLSYYLYRIIPTPYTQYR